MSTKESTKGQKGSSYLWRRKSLARRARRQYPNDRIGWVGGILYFLDTQEPVPGVDQVPKHDGKAEGWKAGFPPLQRLYAVTWEKPRLPRRASSLGVYSWDDEDWGR